MELAALCTELRALLERDAHEIDKDWVEGIRKGWKKLAGAVQTYPDRVTKDDNPMARETIVTAVNGALRYLLRVDVYLDQLRSELLINKGLWSLSKAPVAGKTSATEVATKVIAELDDAKAKINDAMTYARSFADNPYHYGMFKSQADFDFGIRGIGNRVVETMEAVDKIISGKLLRFLNTLLKQIGTGEGEPVLGGEPVAPDTVDIGKVRVTFLDTPLKSKYHDKEKLKAGEVRDPHGRQKFLKSLYKAQAFLKKRDLEFLWYGTILVLPKAKVNLTAYKALTGHDDVVSIAATYRRSSDTVRVYADDLDSSTVIHELGHRYYYKFLTQAGRDHFDKWFGAVKPTSKYGGTNAAEDFAEVFAAYVKGKDMDRDQLERFKSVLNPKAKRTERHALMRELVVLVS